ncbi:MAG: transcription-repair coupling factor, partial [Martelella sp.]
MISGFNPKKLEGLSGVVTIANAVPGTEPLVLAEMARAGQSVAYVLSDGQRIADFEQMLGFVAPEIPVLTLPAWDCLPYDRVSPGADTEARRLSALAGLVAHAKKPHPAIILVTVNAMLQKLPPREIVASLGFSARAGQVIDMDAIVHRLADAGFERVPTVRAVGEYAVRGGILDVFVPGADNGVRLDFFGDTLETIRAFDAASQRTIGTVKSLELNAMSEVTLGDDNIARFRKNYLSMFGAATRDDALYQAVSEGRRYAGMEHWLPLFYERLETMFDYLDGFSVVVDHTAREAAAERAALIEDYYQARRANMGEGRGGAPYKPVPPDTLYLDDKAFSAGLDEILAIRLSPFNEASSVGKPVIAIKAHAGPRWAAEAKAR